MKSHYLPITTTFIITLLIFSSATQAQQARWPGSGTPTDPYQISSSADIKALISNTENLDDNFILTCDIDMDSWQSFYDAYIATNGNEFTGTFDGNYHTIYNLYFSTASSQDIGFFGKTGPNALIKNLALENVTMYLNTYVSSAGALVGFNQGQIKNCSTNGFIGCISNCSNIGGFAGTNSSGQISNSYSRIKISTPYPHINTNQRLGGFVGTNSGICKNCYAAGPVLGGSTANGFAGYSYSTSYFKNCYHLHPNDGGGPTDTYVPTLTAIQMQDPANFITWDFFGETTNGYNEIWYMKDYPILTWQQPVALPEFAMLSEYWLTSGFDPNTPNTRADWYHDNAIDINDLIQLSSNFLQPVVPKIYPPFLVDDFETGNFSYQPWIFPGNRSWTTTNSIAQNGFFSTRSGFTPGNQTSKLELTTYTTGYKFITFYYKVSSERHDKFYFYINGTCIFEDSGESDGWVYKKFPIEDEITTFTFSYEKDAQISRGQDAVWIDTIILTTEE